MKATELRIGNKFHMLGSKMVNTVFAISDNTDRGKFNCDTPTHKEMYSHLITVEENGNQYKPWEMDGIPLTEEWLAKFGFEKNMGFKSMRKSIHTGPVRWESNTYIVVGGIDSWIDVIRDSDGLVFQTPSLPCQYVHQLQNLYFALTGNELELK